jgi:hypothetical protein
MDMWRAAAGDPYPMEKNPDEVPMFARFVERGSALPASDFFKGLLQYYGIEYLNLNPQWYFPRLRLRTLLRGIRGNQAPLDLVPEVLPCEAAAKCQRLASSQRGWHSDARRRGRPLLGVQAH